MSRLTFDGVNTVLELAHRRVIKLQYENSQLIIAPEIAAHAMAATATGPEGKNRHFVREKGVNGFDEKSKYDVEGGHRPAWVLPEGGKKYSFSFPKGTKEFTFANWSIPHCWDKIAFIVDKLEGTRAELRAHISPINVLGNVFEAKIDVAYWLIQAPEVVREELQKGVSYVGYGHHTQFTNENRNRRTWAPGYGFCIPWSLNMQEAGYNKSIVIPIKSGTADQIIDYMMSGKNSDGPVPDGRFLKRENYALLLGDGLCRGKKGLRQNISTGYLAAIDPDQGSLVVMYVPSYNIRNRFDNRWKPEGIFNGTTIDMYVDSGDIAGLTADGRKTLSPQEQSRRSMLELEACGNADNVKVGEHNSVRVITHQFETDPRNIELLYPILKKMTGVDLSKESFDYKR